MSIRFNNSTFYFNKAILLEEAYQKANNSMATISMVKNPFDPMKIKVYNSNLWELLE